MASHATHLLNALKNARTINRKINGTQGSLTQKIFSTTGNIPDESLDNVRGRIALELESLVQNIRAIKRTDPLVIAHPNIHYNIQNLVSRRNWLAHEYGTTAPVKWDEVGKSVFHDVPVIESAIIDALKSIGTPIPPS